MGKNTKNTSERILDAAVSVFARKGYNAASTREIAAEAGLSEGSIFKYYKTKREILLAALDRVIKLMSDDKTQKPFEQIIERNKDSEPTVVLKELIKDRLAVFSENSELLKIVLTEALYNDDISGKFYSAMLENGFPVLLSYFKSCEKNGKFRSLGDGAGFVLLRTFLSISIGFVLQRGFMPGLVAINENTDIDIILEIFLKGMMNNEA